MGFSIRLNRFWFLAFFMVSFLMCSQPSVGQKMQMIEASNPNIQYSGRINTHNPKALLMGYPGVTIKAKFQGTAIKAVFNDFSKGEDASTTYFNVILDDGPPSLLKLDPSQEVYPLASGLKDTIHTIELHKRTEAFVGLVAFKGFQVMPGKTLVTPEPLPARKIEFIGDSQTCGYGIESSETPPKSGFTAINENHYKAWGAITARNLKAQYSCVAYSGRGLYRNFSGTTTGTVPLMYDEVIPEDESVKWNPKNYMPDVIVINLGTNDFSAEINNPDFKIVQDTFVNTYSAFLTKLRTYYPQAKIICTTGVMMSDGYPAGGRNLTRIQQYVGELVASKNKAGDANIFYYKMASQSAPFGEDYHPSASTNIKMATGLTAYINSITGWDKEEPSTH
jgi:lysophospholipase L1-like esterase